MEASFGDSFVSVSDRESLLLGCKSLAQMSDGLEIRLR